MTFLRNSVGLTVDISVMRFSIWLTNGQCLTCKLSYTVCHFMIQWYSHQCHQFLQFYKCQFGHRHIKPYKPYNCSLGNAIAQLTRGIKVEYSHSPGFDNFDQECTVSYVFPCIVMYFSCTFFGV